MEHPDDKAFAHMKASEIMERLLNGEDIPCGENRAYRLVRGHLCYVYNRIGEASVPVEGFPNQLTYRIPSILDCVSAVKREAFTWMRDNMARWRR